MLGMFYTRLAVGLFSFALGKYLGERFLGHKVDAYLMFEAISTWQAQFSKEDGRCYSHQQSRRLALAQFINF